MAETEIEKSRLAGRACIKVMVAQFQASSTPERVEASKHIVAFVNDLEARVETLSRDKASLLGALEEMLTLFDGPSAALSEAKMFSDSPDGEVAKARTAIAKAKGGAS